MSSSQRERLAAETVEERGQAAADEEFTSRETN